MEPEDRVADTVLALLYFERLRATVVHGEGFDRSVMNCLHRKGVIHNLVERQIGPRHRRASLNQSACFREMFAKTI